MSDTPLFDAAEARRRMEAGIARASEGRHELLALATRIARDLADDGGEVTADDVAAELARRGLSWEDLGNAAGAVFRPLIWTGRVTQSKRPSAHGRIIRIWTR